MIAARTRTQFHGQQVRRKARQGSFQSLNRAAAAIRLTAKRSIRKRKGPGQVGGPPSTHTKRLPSSILYFVDKVRQHALIGASRRIIGIAAAEHELGGRWRKERFSRRPFMQPALKKMAPRLPKHWASAIG